MADVSSYVESTIEYIKAQLGYPIVEVELTDDMIEKFIFLSINKIVDEGDVGTSFKSVPALPCQEFEAATVIRVYNNTVASTSTSDPDVFTAKIMYSSNGLSNYKSILLDQAYYDYYKSTSTSSFKFHDNLLYIDGLTGMVTVEYIPSDYGDKILTSKFASDWARRYALALSKEALGRIRGKYTPSTAPFTMDNEALLSEAQEEKQRLEDELYDKGNGFFFVDTD